jgi:hypothetical protein
MPSLFEEGASTLLLLGGMALVIGYLLMRYHLYTRRQPRADAPRSFAKPDPKPRDYDPGKPDDVARWEVHMHDTARELAAMLDSKMAALQELIREADAANQRLKTTLAAEEKAASQIPFSAIGSDVAQGAEPKPKSSGGGVGFNPFRSKPKPPEEDQPQPQSMEARFEQICELADRGSSADEIASRVGVPVGEVQLILGLRGRR